MVFRYKYQNGVWVDLEQPTEDDIRKVALEFSIGERIERELFSPTPAPMVIVDDAAVLLVIHFTAQDTEKGGIENQEIDFIVGEHFIVTVRHQVVAPLYHLKKLLETRDLVAGHEAIVTDVLLEILFAHLYSSVRDHTNNVASRLTNAERDMFNGHERKTVILISDISREFLHLEAALENQEEPLSRFFEALTQCKFFDNSFSERIERVLEERAHVARLVTTHRALATELRETNAALLDARQNEIMKTLTVITFIFLPLELITFVFGMHSLGTPFEQNPQAFWIIMALMLGTVVFTVLWLVRKRWL
jgi:Mg2+ and Co2+ transporter CorA